MVSCTIKHRAPHRNGNYTSSSSGGGGNGDGGGDGDGSSNNNNHNNNIYGERDRANFVFYVDDAAAAALLFKVANHTCRFECTQLLD